MALATPVRILVLNNNPTAEIIFTRVEYTSLSEEEAEVTIDAFISTAPGSVVVFSAVSEESEDGISNDKPTDINEPTADSLAAK